MQGTWNLHKAFVGLKLDFFILFSSLSATHGNYGQGNYASANSFLGSFVQYRHSLGLPCSTIDIGAIEGSDQVSRENHFRSQGVALVQEQELMDAIELCAKQPNALVTHADVDGRAAERNTSIGKYINLHHFGLGLRSNKSLDDPTNRHPMASDIRMSLARQMGYASTQNAADKVDGVQAILTAVAADPEMLNQAGTVAELTLELARTLCGFLMIPDEKVDANMTLDAMGVDSLVSIEIRNWWLTTIGVEISVLEITSAGTVARLGALATELLKKKYRLVPEDHFESSEVSRTDLLADFSSHTKTLANVHGPALEARPITDLPDDAAVFLTGATGFLGSEILKRLLRNNRVKLVIVLVRANSVEHGTERVRATAEALGWWTPEDEARIEVWLGDLSTQALGLASAQLMRLGGESADDTNVDAFIHNGALVTVTASYQSIYQANVGATVELLKLALSSPRSPKFIYVSGSAKMDQNQPFEAVAQDLSAHFGYSQTKILSERLVLDLISRMPRGQNRLSVVKPGLIAGASDNGVTNIDDIIWHLVATAVASGSCPVDSDDLWVYISGVDTIATQIVDQLFTTKCMESFIDITHGMPSSEFWRVICEELGIPHRSRLWDDWIEDVVRNHPDVANHRVLADIAQLVKTNAFAPKKIKDSDVDMQHVYLALRSTVRYLKRLGFFQISAHEPKGMIEKTVRRLGRQKV